MALTPLRLEDQLYTQYSFLVKQVVDEFKPQTQQRADLISAGNEGLSKAINKVLGNINRQYAAESIRNSIRDYLDQNTQVGLVSLDDPRYPNTENPSNLTLGDTIPDTRPSSDPLSVAMLHEAMAHVEQIVDRFPEPAKSILQRRLFAPYYGYDSPMSFKEIGAELGITEKAAQRKYHATVEFIQRVMTVSDLVRIPRKFQDTI